MPEQEFKPVYDPIAETEPETVADIVPAEDVTVIDEQEPNTAASAQEVSPAVIAQKQEAARQWDEAFPGFRGQNDVLPADLQAQMWKNKALSPTTQASPKVDDGPGRPEVVPLPLLDPNVATKRLEQAIIDGDTEAQIAATAEIAAFARGAVETVNSYGMQNEFDIRHLQSEIADLKVPSTIRAAGANMPGFTEADVASAQALVESGRCPDPALAVGYAVNARLMASNSPPPLTAAQIAARKVAAQTAASTPDGAPTSPSPKFVGAERFDSPVIRDALKTDARARAAAEK